MLTPRSLLRIFYDAGQNLLYHDGIEHAGYLAFLGLIAMFPFLVFLAALAGFLGAGDAGASVIKELLTQLPPNVLPAIEPRIAEIISGPPQGLLTISILGAIWTASSAVEGYRTVLNRAYHVASPPSYLFRRMLSIAQTLIFSFLAVITMMVLVLLPIIWAKMESHFIDWHMFDAALLAMNRLTIISTGIIFVLACMTYYVLPNIRQRWIFVAPGAAISTLCWIIAANLLTYYLSQFDQVNLIYGSLGSIIAVLLFFYISNIIFIYGAEFNHLIKCTLNLHVEPAENADITQEP